MNKIIVALSIIFIITILASFRTPIDYNSMPSGITEVQPTINLDSNTLLRILQNHRKKVTLPTWIEDKTLCQLANERLSEVKKTYSHDGFYGQRKTNYSQYKVLGENLIRYVSDELTAYDSWMKSASHSANILDSEFTHTCLVTDGSYAVQIFGAK